MLYIDSIIHFLVYGSQFSLLTIDASNRNTFPSFSSILIKSFFGGCGTSDIHDCSESSTEPYPL